MQTTLRINHEIYREAKAVAARSGVTLTRFIEEALKDRIGWTQNSSSRLVDEVAERHQVMESLLLSTAHFRVGPKPTREEMNER